MVKRKPKTGRPPKPPGEKMSAVVSVRLAPELKEALERACKKSGRTLGQEVGLKLRRALTKREAFGDEQTRNLALLVAMLGMEVTKAYGTSWRDNTWPFAALAAGIKVFLERLQPKAAEEPGLPLSNDDPTEVGTYIANFLLFAMSRPSLPVVRFLSEEDNEDWMNDLARIGHALSLIKDGDDK